MPEICPDCDGGWKTKQIGTHFVSTKCPSCKGTGILPESKSTRARQETRDLPDPGESLRALREVIEPKHPPVAPPPEVQPEVKPPPAAPPGRPRGRPRKLQEAGPKRPRGRPRKLPKELPEDLHEEIPKGFELCPVCKGEKRLRSKKWGTDEPCTACDSTGRIPVEIKKSRWRPT